MFILLFRKQDLYLTSKKFSIKKRVLESFIDFKMIYFTQDGEDIKGQVSITLNKNKRIDHLGIRVELIGVIENLIDKNQNSTFLQIVRDLEPPGALTDNVSYDFQFNRVEK